MSKTCRVCGIEKPLEEFSKCTPCKDGRQRECKACNKESNKKFRESNPSYQKEYWNTPKGHKLRYAASQRFFSKNEGGIYLIKNKVNGYIYIGQSYQLVRREIEWRTYFKNPHLRPRYINEFFREEMDKYGVEAFEWLVLEHMPLADRKELKKREKYYINLFSKFVTLYNRLENKKK